MGEMIQLPPHQRGKTQRLFVLLTVSLSEQAKPHRVLGDAMRGALAEISARNGQSVYGIEPKVSALFLQPEEVPEKLKGGGE